MYPEFVLLGIVLFQQILADMSQVVETKAPKVPRFIVPLQNAEIKEGQR